MSNALEMVLGKDETDEVLNEALVIFGELRVGRKG